MRKAESSLSPDKTESSWRKLSAAEKIRAETDPEQPSMLVVRFSLLQRH